MTKLQKLCIKWLNNNYGNLKPLETEKYSKYIFYCKNGKIIFDYNKETGYVYIHYKEIWDFFELFFGMDYDQIQDLTMKWVEEYYNLKVTTTVLAGLTVLTWWWDKIECNNN
jgi:hypothetical protein